ncbi:MAG: PAS domain S-box protein [Planctomycetaceae bacterium]|nr:PAS domain S-box protein [Planctomycetaceae bacterium]
MQEAPFDDQSDLQVVHRILLLQHDILAQVALGVEINEILTELCCLVEKLVPQSFTSLMLYDPKADVLNLKVAPSVSDEIRSMFATIVPGDRVGSCGAAVLEKKPVIVADTRKSEYWQSLHEVIEKYSLLACWSIPIMAEDDKVLGTFSISHTCVSVPTEQHLRVLESAAYLASIALRRRSDEQQLRFTQFSVDKSSTPILKAETNGRIAYVNQAICDLTGYSHDELLTLEMQDILFKVDSDYWTTGVEAMRSGEPKIIEAFHRRKDGSVLPVEVTMNQFEFEGKQYFVVYVQDITIRRAAEEEFRRRREGFAQAAQSNLMGQMASSIAHEVNQPLSAASNYAFVIEKLTSADEPMMDRIREMAASLREQVVRAAQIVAGVRSLITKTLPKREESDIHDVIKKAVSLLEPDLLQSQIELVEQFDRGLPLIQIDALQVEQVAVNLIRNAMEALQELYSDEKVITLSTRRIDDHSIEVVVRDNGPGVTVGKEGFIFGAFNSGKENGMGMGLAISRSIVESHGGHLVADRVDAGARLRFSLKIKSRKLSPSIKG